MEIRMKLTVFRLKTPAAPFWLFVNEDRILVQLKEDKRDATAYASIVEAEKALAWVQDIFGFLDVEIEKGFL